MQVDNNDQRDGCSVAVLRTEQGVEWSGWVLLLVILADSR